MSEKTAIAWTRSTRNFWAGCTKVGPGCDGCYAEAFQRWIQGKDPESGEAKNWGPGRPRVPYLEGAATELRRLNHKAIRERDGGILWHGRQGFWPVFINSHSDFFDNEVPQEWRDFAFAVIEECTALTFFLVTKRVGNVERMVPDRWMQKFPDYVRVLITVVNNEEAHRDIPKLLALPCKNGISYEPALEEVDWSPWLWPTHWHWDGQYRTPEEALAAGAAAERRPQALVSAHAKFVQWLIVGGESDQAGHETRPFVLGWAKRAVQQCRESNTPVFIKQLGSRPTNREGEPHLLKHPKGEDPSEWPALLQVQEFPA